MIIGFTGTQLGMSRQQKVSVMKAMVDLDITELHHGDCLGADSERICRSYAFWNLGYY